LGFFFICKNKKGNIMSIMYGVRQIRVTPELDSGAADGSAVAINSTMIQQVGMSSIYIDGAEGVQRGGDSIKAVVKEDDTYSGEDLTLDFAALEPALKKAIVGGVVVANKWSAPKDATENPYPFRLEVWQANYTESDSESSQDGFVKHEFAYCKGRLGGNNGNQQAFSNDQFTVRARKNASNPSAIESPWTHDEVSAIV
jgi:hypothetical protein